MTIVETTIQFRKQKIKVGDEVTLYLNNGKKVAGELATKILVHKDKKGKDDASTSHIGLCPLSSGDNQTTARLITIYYTKDISSIHKIGYWP